MTLLKSKSFPGKLFGYLIRLSYKMKFLSYFLISILTKFCESGFLPCEDCALRKTQLPVAQLKLLRHEYLKNEILKKLHLTEPPRINLPKPPLNSYFVIAEMAQSGTTLKSDNEPKKESIVLYPKKENFMCLNHESYLCDRFEFSTPDNLLLENFISAEIWIFQNNTKVIQIYQIFEDHLQNTTSSYELSNSGMKINGKSWNKYSIFDYMFWRNDYNLVIEIINDKNEIQFEKETQSIRGSHEIPFLVIERKVDNVKSSTRQKRSTTCGDTIVSCCKENFFLNFSEIGWDNWILHPEGYQANFCRGRCFNDFSNTRFYHSAVLLSFIHDNKDLAEEIGLSMCCTPSIMSPLTIFYRNEEQLIYQKSIDNMKVEACDCA